MYKNYPDPRIIYTHIANILLFSECGGSWVQSVQSVGNIPFYFSNSRLHHIYLHSIFSVKQFIKTNLIMKITFSYCSPHLSPPFLPTCITCIFCTCVFEVAALKTAGETLSWHSPIRHVNMHPAILLSHWHAQNAPMPALSVTWAAQRY